MQDYEYDKHHFFFLEKVDFRYHRNPLLKHQCWIHTLFLFIMDTSILITHPSHYIEHLLYCLSCSTLTY